MFVSKKERHGFNYMKHPVFHRKKFLTALAGGVFVLSLFGMTSFLGKEESPVTDKKPVTQETIKNSVHRPGEEELKGVDSIRLLLNTSTSTSVSQHYDYSISMSDSSSDGFILGYYGTGEMYLPLTFYYTVTKADGSMEERSTAASKKSSSALYDAIGEGVGNDMTSQYSFISALNIPLEDPDETIDASSIYMTNIFASYYDDARKDYYPDLTKKYYLSGPRLRFKENTSLDDIFQIHLNEISTYENKIAFKCSYTMNGAAEKLKNSMDESEYQTHSEEVEKGVEAIRYRFYSFNTSYYEVFYNDGSSVRFPVQYETGNGQSWIDLNVNGGQLVFMVNREDVAYPEKLNLDNVSDLWIDNARIRMEFYVIDTGKSASSRKATFNFTFGMIDTTSENESVKRTSYVLITWIIALVSAAVYAGLAVGLYFYRKNKYKNDEFLRVNTKSYIKQAAIFLLVAESLIMEITAIVFRATSLNNSTIVQNPTDKWIIIFALTSIISIGYLIKWTISAAKIRSERRKTEKLHLNDTVVDDGTVNLAELEKHEQEKKKDEAESSVSKA